MVLGTVQSCCTALHVKLQRLTAGRVACVQVEHPVTEGITETNIPSIQLMIGMGIPLWRIACIRATFNKDPNVSVGLRGAMRCLHVSLAATHATWSRVPACARPAEWY